MAVVSWLGGRVVHRVVALWCGLRGIWRSAVAREATILFLERQLALYQERGVRPRRAAPRDRLALALLSILCDWRRRLVVVRPTTLVRWHRAGFRLLWRRRSSRPGRPPLPGELRELIAAMARDNPTWGQDRVAAELALKLGLKVSPRTVRRYWPTGLGPAGRGEGGDQRWATFVRNHAEAIVACDFLTVVTASFRVLYVLVVIELGSRKLVHCNVTANPTAQWTRRQLVQAIPYDHRYRFLIHDRSTTFSRGLDDAVRHLGLTPLTTPVRAPKANAFCERVIGTLRRECLDWLIPLSENHLRRILGRWMAYYNEARPHASLGPGFPAPPEGVPVAPQANRHRLPADARVAVTPVLGGLHHDYRLKRAA